MSESSVQPRLDDFFAEVPTNIETKLEVPSRCLFYKDKNPNDTVTVRPMKFEDEKLLASLNEDEAQNAITVLVGRCLLDVAVDELLPMDLMSILAKIRSISFGPDYPVNHACPKCHEINELNFNLDTIPLKPIEEDAQDPEEIFLPTLKRKAIVKRSRLSDRILKELSPEESLNSLWRFVLQLEDKDGEMSEDKVFISHAIDDERFPVLDLHLIANVVSGRAYGLDDEAKYKCSNCKTLNIVGLPITADFFSLR